LTVWRLRIWGSPTLLANAQNPVQRRAGWTFSGQAVEHYWNTSSEEGY